MTELSYCKISKINYTDGTASLTLEDHENQVVTGVPFLAGEYEMPKIGDTVAAILNKTNGRIERGVILGKVFSKSNRPVKSGAGVYYKAFSDGGYIHYDPSEGTLNIKVDKVTMDKMYVREIITE